MQKSVFYFAFVQSNLDNVLNENEKLHHSLERIRRKGAIQLENPPKMTKEILFNDFTQTQRNRLALFHFAGHANKETLDLFDGEFGGQSLASLIKNNQSNLHLVFLNGCATYGQVQGLLEGGVKVVIATHRSIEDKAALHFAEAFYHSLFAEKPATIAQAYQNACDKLKEFTAHSETITISPMRSAIKKSQIIDRKKEDFVQQWGIFTDDPKALEWTIEQVIKDEHKPILLTSPPFQPPFVLGRDSDLEAVHKRLFEGDNFLMLVNGQGGIGKTTFAAKYWAEYGNDYSHLAFLFVENGIANALLTLSRKLGLEFTTETQEEQMQKLIEAVSNLTKPCLLILDNANNEEDLNENIVWLRKCPNFHILLTSRLADFEYAQKYPIGTLSKEDALQMFKEHYKKMQESETPLFEEIYEAVGGNTLVLELLAKNLTNFNKLRQKYSLQMLKENLQKSLLELSHSKEVKTEYQAKGTGIRYETPEAIILAMYDLTDLQESEIVLLSVFAVLPAENIEFETLNNFLQDENLDDTLLSLAQKGWIEQNETAFKISPVVQEITRHKNQERLFADCEKMIDFLIDELDRDNIHKDNYKYATLYSRYAESVVNHFEPKFEIGNLCERIGNFYETVGNLSNALQFFDKCNQIFSILSSQNPNSENIKNALAISYSKLGETHSSLGDLAQALRFFEKYNQLKKELYEAYPSNVDFKNGLAISYSKLGETHSRLGDLAQALEFFEKDIELSKELYEAYPSNVGFKNALAISYSKLGETHSSLGDLAQALRFFEKRNQLGKELYESYPSNVDFKNGLAISYEKLGETHSSLGDLAQALEFFEKRNQLGKELSESYPSNVGFKEGLAISYEKLGQTHSSLGDLKKALDFYEKMNLLFKELYESYPSNVGFKNGLATAICWLGIIYSSLGNLEKALPYFEEYNKLSKDLYESYPSNVGFKNGLAISYSKLGETHSSLGNLQQALQFFEIETKLFEDLYEVYPSNVGFKNGLAISYSKLGEVQSSLGNLQQALQFFEIETQLFKELYESYPSNVGFKNGLAISYYKLYEIYLKMNKKAEAKRYLVQAVGLFEELKNAYPSYAQFTKFYGIAKNQLASLE
ncbi:tetratricopeptide repeat protein [Hugenholtzia roseola]|uniref:tetratricopeptide repeat protein n=1 Tax=Hugenholtzia roseola TaxID=1002 RepID=UPI00041E5619|nr:tetratricopeptide repeat protein [Hugenholtzia roseola]